MHFLIEDEELFKKYNDIWSKASNSMENVFDSKPIYNKIICESQNKILQ